MKYFQLLFLLLLGLQLLSCEEELYTRDETVQWTNVPKRKFSHDTIRVNLPAQGDTLEYIGNKYNLWLREHENFECDTVISHYDKWQDTIVSDTAIYKHITVVLRRDQAHKTSILKIMARSNTTSQKVRLPVRVGIFPMYTDPFVIIQEPMTTTEGKNRSGNNIK